MRRSLKLGLGLVIGAAAFAASFALLRPTTPVLSPAREPERSPAAAPSPEPEPETSVIAIPTPEVAAENVEPQEALVPRVAVPERMAEVGLPPSPALPSPSPVAQREAPAASPPEPASELPPVPVSAPPLEPVSVSPPSSAPAKSDQWGHIGFRFGMEYSRVDSRDLSTDAVTTFLSQLSPRVNFDWDYQWTPQWSSFMSFGVTFETISDDTASPAREIVQASGTRKTWELGARRNWSSDAATSLSIGMQDRLFSHAPSLTQLQIDRVTAGFAGIEHRQTLFRLGKASGFADARAEYVLGATTSQHATRPGVAAELALGFFYEFRGFAVTTQVDYAFSSLESGIVRQSEKRFGGTFGIAWRIAW